MNRILIIGNSKAAKNLSYYLEYKKIPHKIIPYRKTNKYKKYYSLTDIIFILTKDKYIYNFYKKFKKYLNPQTSLFHFSGSIYHKNIVSIHPIFSFKKKPINPKKFEKLIFTSENPLYVKKHLKWFKNKIIKLNPNHKPLYHALISIYLNFPLVIKNITEKKIHKLFKIPKNYLQNVFLKNIKDSIDNKGEITGPITRKDTVTIKKHLSALKNTNYFKLYKSIINLWRSNENK